MMRVRVREEAWNHRFVVETLDWFRWKTLDVFPFFSEEGEKAARSRALDIARRTVSPFIQEFNDFSD